MPKPLQYLKALYLALNDPETPRLARIVAWLTIAYALSPIDLIPDFIPVLGHLDDAIIIPLGILLVRRLIPKEAWQRALERADGTALPVRSIAGMALVVFLWLLVLSVLCAAGYGIYRHWAK